MNKDLEYYLNNPLSTCVQVPPEDKNYLEKRRYLSEYTTEDEKQVVRDNIGVTEALKELKNLLDLKVIQKGGIAWDTEPTIGHETHVLSSDSLYKEFDKYVLKLLLESKNEIYWNGLLAKVDEKINSFLKTIETLKEIVNNQEDSVRYMLDTLMCEYSSGFEERLQEIESKLTTIKNLASSKAKNGIAVANKFGNDENISISQKTLTEAINNVYKALSDITGRPSDNRIRIIISPDKFVSENEGQVIISVQALDDIFEKIKIFINGLLIVEDENVRTKSYQTTITESSNIRVEAYILGKLYTEEKTINKYYPLFIGSGITWQKVLDTDYVRLAGSNLTGSYPLHIKEPGDKIFIIAPLYQKDHIQRIHMNGYDIPFDIIETDEYIIYSSKNNYRSEDCVINIQAN